MISVYQRQIVQLSRLLLFTRAVWPGVRRCGWNDCWASHKTHNTLLKTPFNSVSQCRNKPSDGFTVRASLQETWHSRHHMFEGKERVCCYAQNALQSISGFEIVNWFNPNCFTQPTNFTNKSPQDLTNELKPVSQLTKSTPPLSPLHDHKDTYLQAHTNIFFSPN